MLTHILLGVMHFWEIKGDFYHLQAASQCPSQYSTPHNTAGKYHFETLHHSVQRIQLSHSEWLSSTSCQFQNVNKCLIPTNMTKAIRNMSRGKVPSLLASLHIRRWRINNVVLILNLSQDSSQSNIIGRNFVNLLVLMPSFMDDYRENGDFWGRSKGRSEEEEYWIEERKNKFFGRRRLKKEKRVLLNKEMWKKVSLKRKRTGRTR